MPKHIERIYPARDPHPTWTGSNNVVVTWTARIAHRPAHFAGGGWGVIDALGHKLHLPRWAMRPICDRFDIAVGIPKADLVEMDYVRQGKSVPWWLR